VPAEPPKRRHPQPHLGLLVATLSKRAVGRFEARLAAHGSSLTVWTVVRELAESGPVSQRELADRLLLKGPSLVPRLDALEEAGIARRMPDPHDRRVQRVTLTAGGLALFHELAVYSDENEGELISPLGRAEQEQLRALVVRLLEHLDGLEEIVTERAAEDGA
jgi:MarR family transcriptional regulator for hemolysin